MNPSPSHLIYSILKISLSFFLCLIIFFLVLSAYTKIAGPLPFAVKNTMTQNSEAFNVSGTGKSSIKPDKAIVRLGVTADGATADAAKNKMNETINKVTAAIKALGVEENDIKTENLNVYQNYDNVKPLPLGADQPEVTILPAPQPGTKDPNSRATSYNANTNLVVTVKNVDLANKIIDEGTKNGANQIGGVQFDNTDNSAAEADARQKAIEDAKKKAQTAAQAAGFKLGKLINYNEGGSGGPVFYDKAMPMAAESRAGGTPTQVQPGENEVTVTVTLSYEIL